MGRVRKYKKFKACDPFSKKGRAEVDTIHDEPPDIHEEKCNELNILYFLINSINVICTQ